MKCLLKLLVAGALLLALVVGGVVFAIDGLAKTAITKGVTFATAQETTLGSAHVGLFSGELGFEELEIANPPGFQQGPMLSVASFKTALDLSQAQQDVIDLTELALDGLVLNLELKGKEHNLGPLLERLEELKGAGGEAPPTGEPGPDEPTGAPEPAEPGPELRIGRIAITGVRTNLRISGVPLADGVYQLAVPDIVIEDFDDDMQQATVYEWSAYLVETLLNASLAAGDGSFPYEWQRLLSMELAAGGLLDGDLDQVLENLEGRARDELDALEQQGKDELKQLESEYKEQLREDPAGAVDKAKDDLKDAESKLKGLFGKDKKD